MVGQVVGDGVLQVLREVAEGVVVALGLGERLSGKELRLSPRQRKGHLESVDEAKQQNSFHADSAVCECSVKRRILIQIDVEENSAGEGRKVKTDVGANSNLDLPLSLHSQSGHAFLQAPSFPVAPQTSWPTSLQHRKSRAQSFFQCAAQSAVEVGHQNR